ncbi:MAG: threonine synthase [Rhodospirillales bacterium]|nr:threonine synthase [Rhodospirillales bacterium]
MKYVSTRGQAPILDFDDALLSGLARDGGLYVPESWPNISADEIAALKGLSYSETAFRIMRLFTGDSIGDDDLAHLINDAYAGFDDPDVAPMKQLGENEWLMELFHGPTLAFKDYAMQFLGRIFDFVLTRRGKRVTIVGATSGDTGSAAIEACRGRDAIEIFILHPEGRVSDVQRRQMTTITDSNVHNIAVKGTFDDCQNMVKAMFNDTDFRDRCNLSAVNSINWARVMAQTVYYFRAAAGMYDPTAPVSFAVPTGNFGNVFAGYGAKRMGLNIEQLIIGSNSNDILTRFFEAGRMEMTGIHPTISPSMDIQISSNFERLLFELYGRDGNIIKDMMTTFNDTGSFSVGEKEMARARELFAAARFSDEETSGTIARIFAEHKQLLDPHSAIGVAAGRARRRNPGTPLIDLATAHPAKFPDAVRAASGQHPALPEKLSDLFDREERFNVLDNDLTGVQEFVLTHRTDGTTR